MVDAALAAHFAAPTRWYPGNATTRLRHLTAVVRSAAVTRLHWSLFWVAEAGGTLVGTLACYRNDGLPRDGIADAVQDLEAPLAPAASAAIVEAVVLTAPRSEPGEWVLDHAAVLEQPNEGAVLTALIDAALGEGRCARADAAYAEVPIGRDELRRAFLSQGLTSQLPADVRIRPKRYRPVECFRHRFA